MDAIIIDLKDFGTRTPEQAVRVFFELYTPEAVETALWELFKVCALAEKGNHGSSPELTATANLFDHLIALTKAVHELRESTLGRCTICGRNPPGEDS